MVQGATVLELGAGLGVPGLVAWLAGAASVMLTDLAENLPLLHAATATNLADVADEAAAECGREGAGGAAGGSARGAAGASGVNIASLDWGAQSLPDALRREWTLILAVGAVEISDARLLTASVPAHASPLSIQLLPSRRPLPSSCPSPAHGFLCHPRLLPLPFVRTQAHSHNTLTRAVRAGRLRLLGKALRAAARHLGGPGARFDRRSGRRCGRCRRWSPAHSAAHRHAPPRPRGAVCSDGKCAWVGDGGGACRRRPLEL